jgi:hypothetical protein
MWKVNEKRYFQISYFKRALRVDALEIHKAAVIGSRSVLIAPN